MDAEVVKGANGGAAMGANALELSSPSLERGDLRLLAEDTDGAYGLYKKPFNWKAPVIILVFELLESLAYSGVALNLVIYLGVVLHGTTASNAANVDAWNGTTFLAPVVAAFLADTYFGKYKTIAFSCVVYLLGMVLITLSAAAPALRPAPCEPGSTCLPATGFQKFVFFLALYLIAVGTGGVKAALMPLGADQYDERNPEESKKKQSFFTWYFGSVNLGIFIAGTLFAWIEQNFAYALGFGLGALCLAVAVVAFFTGSSTYRMQVPSGSPIKSVGRVLNSAFKRRKLAAPSGHGDLYELEDSASAKLGRQKLGHTDGLRFLDKAAVVAGGHSSTLCTVTDVEEVKIIFRMLPIWFSCVLYAGSLCQMTTTFIQQGLVMDRHLGGITVPAASLVSVEVAVMLVWVAAHDRLLIPIAQTVFKNPAGLTQLQRLGIGRFLVTLTMAAAAILEGARLRAVHAGGNLSIAWQIPQFVVFAGSDVFCGVAQLEFFYSEAPQSMRSICSAFSFLALSLGYYLNSLVLSIVAAVTSSSPGGAWMPQDLNNGHLDNYFWLWTALSAVNFVLFTFIARNYKLKKVVAAVNERE